MINTGDTAFMLVATALVMLMTPGLALFYGGLVRSKNVLTTVLQSFLCLGIVSIIMKFSAFILFTVLWTTFVYLPVCHWVWGGGWLGNMGALDFAGGTVIHINSGAAALVVAVMLGKRKGWGKEAFLPHNLPMTVFGAGILWFGWFGFNAGSALSAGKIATMAFMTTQIASGTAAVFWVATEWILRGRPTALGAASGAVAGLVAITPAAGFVGPVSALIIGLIAGILCYLALTLKNKFGYDDALDVVAIHGAGGLWGALATGLFATTAVNPDGADGLFFGNPNQFVIQSAGAFAAIVFSITVTAIIVKFIDMTIGLRVSDEEEVRGLDLSQHSEVGYTF